MLTSIVMHNLKVSIKKNYYYIFFNNFFIKVVFRLRSESMGIWEGGCVRI